MFTGIIEEVGEIFLLQRGAEIQKIAIKARKVLDGTGVGDSINIDGACHTVIDIDTGTFTVESVEETLRRTTLGELKVGDRVNLERALHPSDRLGGHFVLGHVDGVGVIIGRRDTAGGSIFTIKMPEDLKRYVAAKGSIALDGISLTVVGVELDRFTVSIVPHTLKSTTLSSKRIGGKVNLEVDVLARYLERLTEGRTDRKITERWLHQMGF
ncbi:MAG TPA: riboflavin synthase [Candidatus Latescibacteria bacterium]|nr:riboflavin synthase [Candidatus Latescibacterota bacterium]